MPPPLCHLYSTFKPGSNHTIQSPGQQNKQTPCSSSILQLQLPPSINFLCIIRCLTSRPFPPPRLLLLRSNPTLPTLCPASYSIFYVTVFSRYKNAPNLPNFSCKPSTMYPYLSLSPMPQHTVHAHANTGLYPIVQLFTFALISSSASPTSIIPPLRLRANVR